MKFFFFYYETQSYVHFIEVKDIVSPVCNPNPHRIDPGFVHRMALESIWFFFERVTDLEVYSGKAVKKIPVHAPCYVRNHFSSAPCA